MHYVLVTEYETTGFTTCKIQGFTTTELRSIEGQLTSLNITYSKQGNSIEVDTQGVYLLNLLANSNYGYRVSNQSMVIEKSIIGGRTMQVQKIVWTLSKE